MQTRNKPKKTENKIENKPRRQARRTLPHQSSTTCSHFEVRMRTNDYFRATPDKCFENQEKLNTTVIAT